MLIHLFLSLITGYSVSSSTLSDCCTKGYEHAKNVLIHNANCEPDKTVTDSFTDGYMNLMCVGFFKQCCKSTAKTQYCTRGERLALANQLCLNNDNVGGSHQKKCCECCNMGRKEGLRGGMCEKNDQDYLCRSSFTTCCNKAKEVTPTDQPTNKSCKDITCSNTNSQGCSVTANGPLCSCKTGYENIEDGTCQDKNECLVNNPCYENSQCINTVGSYSCKCKEGYVATGNKCQKKDEIKCESGYQVVNGKCEDINECTSGTHRCPSRSFCLNEEGDYRCFQNCPYPNYQVISIGVCEDVDECKRGLDNCQENFKCVNSVGTYHCKRERCDKGYKLVDGLCEDIDECESDKRVCGEKGECRNAHGSFYCDCQQGYSVNSKNGKCEDVDECKVRKNICDYQCINNEGSYKCVCPAGYESHGRYCYDVDECSQGKQCASNMFCFNTFGSHACINQSCPNKYFVQTSPKLNEPQNCQKVDCNGDTNCNSIQLQSVKRVTYRFYRDVGYRAFVFNYWTSFDSRYYIVNTYFAKGNEDKTFYIEYFTSSQIKIINQKAITGPKTIHLVMQTDVKTRRGVFQWRYQYHFYVYIAAYNFS